MAKRVKSTKKPVSDEPAYKSWTAIIGTVVAVLSLLSNVILGFAAYRLSQSKNRIENQLNEVRLENERLSGLAKRREVNVDLEARYYVVSGLSILEIEAADVGNPENRPAVIQNQVLQQLQPWKEKWETGESTVVNENGIQRNHGVVLLRINNRGKETAQRVILTVRQKDFSSQGETAEDLWELRPDTWQEDKIRLADLQAGQSIIVPLTHTLGTNKYFGRTLLPTKVEWFNPTLQTQESMTVDGMAPEDQWISKGLNIRVAQ